MMQRRAWAGYRSPFGPDMPFYNTSECKADTTSDIACTYLPSLFTALPAQQTRIFTNCERPQVSLFSHSEPVTRLSKPWFVLKRKRYSTQHHRETSSCWNQASSE